jgi:hypothetical protein
MKGIYRLWNGDLALPDAFWNWSVFGGLVVNIASSAPFLFLIMADRPIAAFILGYALSAPPLTSSSPSVSGDPLNAIPESEGGLTSRGS